MDSLFGGPGGDTLFGGGGSDELHPEAGDDTANGGSGSGSDTVVVTPIAQPATVDLAIGVRQDTGDGSDLLVGFENARSDASLGATLRGDDGGNVLTGNEGDDTLEGRGGIDVRTPTSVQTRSLPATEGSTASTAEKASTPPPWTRWESTR